MPQGERPETKLLRVPVETHDIIREHARKERRSMKDQAAVMIERAADATEERDALAERFRGPLPVRIGGGLGLDGGGLS